MKTLCIRDLIKEVSTAIDPNEIRRDLTYMRVLCKPDRLVFTGSNGIKLIEKTYPIQIGWDKTIYIPAAALQWHASMSWYGINDIGNSFAPISLHNTLKGITVKYPKYEPLFRFSHRKDNVRKTIARQTVLASLKKTVPTLDGEDDRRLPLTELGWSIDKDVNGRFLFEMMKALHSDKLVARSDPRHKYITLIGENERALLTTLKCRA